MLKGLHTKLYKDIIKVQKRTTLFKNLGIEDKLKEMQEESLTIGEMIVMKNELRSREHSRKELFDELEKQN